MKLPRQPEIFGPLITAATVLRHWISGGVFLAVYCYTQNPNSPTSQLKLMSENVWVTLGITVVAGVSLYSFHRSFPNIIIEHIREYFVSKMAASKSGFWKAIRNFIAPPRILRLSRRRWLYLADVKKFHTHVTDWGDYIHLQYCAVWAICAASLITFMTSSVSFDIWLLLLGSVLFLFAFLSDLRKQVVEEWLYSIDDKIQLRFFRKEGENKHDACKDNEIAEATEFFERN